MDNNSFSFKELEKVSLKATYTIEIGSRTFEPGEIITAFDKIQIAGLNETNRITTAHGGFDDRARVFWETAKEEQLVFSQGVFTAAQFALLNNSRLLEVAQNTETLITEIEELESDEHNNVTLKHTPKQNLYLYEKATGARITTFTINANVITISNPYIDVVVTYTYAYTNSAQIIQLGQRFLNGFLELEGRTRIKDDITGNVTTGIIRIPRLKLMSDLSIRLGTQASPNIASFRAVAVPVGSRGNTYISEMILLSDDIESDL